MKILFEGDSVTNGSQVRSDFHDLGEGYPKYAAAMIQDSCPDETFEFMNFSVCGDRTEQILARVDHIAAQQPDVASLLIGVNDVWHFYRHGVVTTDAAFEQNCRQWLTILRERTNAKLLVIQPFLLETPDKEHMRPALLRKQEICQSLAEELADAYLPLDDFLRSMTREPPEFYASDGIHPTADGACVIGEAYLHAVLPLIDSILGRKH